jgi:hypothetical protein
VAFSKVGQTGCEEASGTILNKETSVLRESLFAITPVFVVQMEIVPGLVRELYRSMAWADRYLMQFCPGLTT